MGYFNPNSGSNFRGNRSENRSFSGGRGGFGGGRGRDSGGRGGFGGGRDRRPLEMHDVVCDKCGEDCQVPFKPSGDKPVLCSGCFEKSGGGSSRGGRDSRGGSRGGFGGGRDRRPQSGGVSPADFKALSEKVDKILKILENVEIEEDDEDESDEEEKEDESEEESDSEENSK